MRLPNMRHPLWRALAAAPVACLLFAGPETALVMLKACGAIALMVAAMTWDAP